MTDFRSLLTKMTWTRVHLTSNQFAYYQSVRSKSRLWFRIIGLSIELDRFESEWKKNDFTSSTRFWVREKNFIEIKLFPFIHIWQLDFYIQAFF